MNNSVGYKFIAELNINNNKHLPSPIRVMVGANNNTYIKKYFENKILKLCKQYNYVGYLDIDIKYLRGNRKNNKIINKIIYVDKKNRIIKNKPLEDDFEEEY